MGTFLSIVVVIALGAVVGWLASSMMGSKLSLLWCIGLGIAGALVGSLIARLFSFAAVTLFRLLLAVVGACLVIYFVQKVQEKK